MKRERWKIISANANYEISDHGRIRRKTIASGTRIGKILYQGYGNSARRYKRVTLHSGGRPRHYLVHRLVAIAFLGTPRGKRREVDHIDGDNKNNHLSNLRWVTHQENEDHKIVTETRTQGEAQGCSKLKAREVFLIRGIYAEGGITINDLASAFGVAYTTVQALLCRRTWKHVP